MWYAELSWLTKETYHCSVNVVVDNQSRNTIYVDNVHIQYTPSQVPILDSRAAMSKHDWVSSWVNFPNIYLSHELSQLNILKTIWVKS